MNDFNLAELIGQAGVNLDNVRAVGSGWQLSMRISYR